MFRCTALGKGRHTRGSFLTIAVVLIASCCLGWAKLPVIGDLDTAAKFVGRPQKSLPPIMGLAGLVRRFIPDGTVGIRAADLFKEGPEAFIVRLCVACSLSFGR